MRLADKIATMARRGAPLPYDAEVEWIQGDGNCLIDTGIKTDDEDAEYHFVLNFLFDENITVTSSTDVNAYIFAARSRYGLYQKIQNNVPVCGTYFPRGDIGGQKDIGINNLDLTINTTGRIRSYINGRRLYDVTYPQDIDKNNTWKLFLGGRGKISSLLVSKDSVDILNLKSVRMSTTEGAMYDSVSGQLFRNAGTGAFILGHDVVSSRGGVLNA